MELSKWVIAAAYMAGIAACIRALIFRYAFWLALLIGGLIAGFGYHMVIEALLSTEWKPVLLGWAPGVFWGHFGAWLLFLATVLQAIAILFYVGKRIVTKDPG